MVKSNTPHCKKNDVSFEIAICGDIPKLAILLDILPQRYMFSLN